MSEQSRDGQARVVGISVDGLGVEAREGDSVAVAMLRADLGWTRRSAVSGAPRAAYCLMGVCFDCLVTIDGRASQQGCLVRVREGMRVERPVGLPRPLRAPAP